MVYVHKYHNIELSNITPPDYTCVKYNSCNINKHAPRARAATASALDRPPWLRRRRRAPRRVPPPRRARRHSPARRAASAPRRRAGARAVMGTNYSVTGDELGVPAAAARDMARRAGAGAARGAGYFPSLTSHLEQRPLARRVGARPRGGRRGRARAPCRRAAIASAPPTSPAASEAAAGRSASSAPVKSTLGPALDGPLDSQ